jgi:site-specific recombinase XerD
LNKNNERLVNRYLSLRSNSITERTKGAFADDLRVFIRFLDDKGVEDVTHKDIDAFLEHCRVDRGNGDEALSRKYNTLNKFYDTMILKEYLNMTNPLNKVERIKVRNKVRDHVTLDEYKQIIKYLEQQKDYRGLALFSLFYSSGIRVNEAHRLNKNDIDFENNEFDVMGKGDQGRTCIFSDEAKGYIIQYLNSRDDNLEALFVSHMGNRWSVSSIQQYVKNTAKKAGVKKNVHPHLLRHGTAMLLLDNGLPLDEIQKVLGHRNINTTQIYARTSMKRVKKDVNNIYNKTL